MANQSKVAGASGSLSSRIASSTKPAGTGARRRTTQNDEDKENKHARRTVPSKRHINDADDYEEDVDGSSDENEHDEDDDDDAAAQGSDGEAAVPTRSGRTRRASEKQAQHQEEKEEAAQRKAAKVARTIKRQRRLEEAPEEIPLQDTVFTSREVNAPVKKKALQQRDSRVPSTQARPTTTGNPARGRTHEPSQDLRQIIANHPKTAPRASTSTRMEGYNETPRRGLGSSSIRDWRRSTVDQGPVGSDDESRPRSINGHVFPAHIQLDLRDDVVPHDYFPEPSDRGRHPHQPRRKSVDRQPSISPPPSARSSSPVIGDKRAHSPDSDVHNTQAQKINDHQGRARAKDYDDITQELISGANTWYRCFLATEDGFPEHATETEMVNRSWNLMCKELKVSMRLTPEIAKLIMRRGPQMRGELKTKVRALVELVYGFESGQNKKTLRKNRQRSEDLKEGLGFCYEKSPADAAERKGIYRAKIIQKAVNQMWFNNKRDEGATHPELFGPAFPKPAFALTLTAIECGIDEWATGIKTDVPFTAAEYRSVYQDHLKALGEFEKHTAPRNILGNILSRVHNIGRFHSGAQPLTSFAPSTTLSRAAIDAAIKEYDEESVTESDGENGERTE